MTTAWDELIAKSKRRALVLRVAAHDTYSADLLDDLCDAVAASQSSQPTEEDVERMGLAILKDIQRQSIEGPKVVDDEYGGVMLDGRSIARAALAVLTPPLNREDRPTCLRVRSQLLVAIREPSALSLRTWTPQTGCSTG